MSTPEPVGVKAERPAERILFQGLFDDAAVFPPGLATLATAVADHVGRQSSSYADLVGPLLLPASAIEELLRLGHAGMEAGLKVALIGRPGTSLALVQEALSRLAERPDVTVSGVEIGWSADWRRAAGGEGILLSLEVPRGAELDLALSDIQAHAHDQGQVSQVSQVQAKFRTGSTPEQPAPTSTELAAFIRASVDRDLGFKLTGGLHHAISATTSSGETRLGFLNVIAATRYALAHGAEVPEMDSLLCQPDTLPILDIITRMSQADVSVLRAFFTSYGCCGVLDPIGDLADLGLITLTREAIG